MILLQFLLRVGAPDDDDLIVVMGRSLVRRCRTQFLWRMAPRDDGDDGMILLLLLIWVEMEGGMMRYPSIHPTIQLISPPRLFLFFADTTPLSSPISMADGAAQRW
jgi:hypothetical protein